MFGMFAAEHEISMSSKYIFIANVILRLGLSCYMSPALAIVYPD